MAFPALRELIAATLVSAKFASKAPASTEKPLMRPTHSRLLHVAMLVKRALTVLMPALADFALMALANTDAPPTRLLTILTSWELLAVMPVPSQLTAPMLVPAASASMAPASTDVLLRR